MAFDLNKIFVLVPQENVDYFVDTYILPSNGGTRSHAYDNRIVFLGKTGQIFTHGEIYGVDSDEIKKIINKFKNLTNDTVQESIDAVKKSILGKQNENDTNIQTIGDVSHRVKNIEDLIKNDVTEDGNSIIDRFSEIINWFKDVADTETCIDLINKINGLSNKVENLSSSVSSHSTVLSTITGDVSTDGSIANAINNSHEYTDSKLFSLTGEISDVYQLHDNDISTSHIRIKQENGIITDVELNLDNVRDEINTLNNTFNNLTSGLSNKLLNFKNNFEKIENLDIWEEYSESNTNKEDSTNSIFTWNTDPLPTVKPGHDSIY